MGGVQVSEPVIARINNWLPGAYGRLIIFACSIASVIFLFYQANSKFDPSDPIIELQIVDVAKKKELGVFAAKVNVGMVLKDFPKFDLVRNDFVADMVLWFEYDPDKVMLETISRFSFDNGDIIHKSPPDIRTNQGNVLVKYDLRVAFKSSLTYQRFPLDNHRISLVLTNNFVTPGEVYFICETTDFGINRNIFLADWKIEDLETDAGFLEMKLEEKEDSQKVAAPKVRFTVNLSKRGAKDVYIMFMPLYIVTFIAIFSFLTSLFAAQPRSVMSATAVPALLGYRFVLQNLLPHVGYLTTADYIYLLLLVIAFSILVSQALLVSTATSISSNDSDQEWWRSFLIMLNTLLFLVMNFVIVLGTYFFLPG